MIFKVSSNPDHSMTLRCWNSSKENISSADLHHSSRMLFAPSSAKELALKMVAKVRAIQCRAQSEAFLLSEWCKDMI